MFDIMKFVTLDETRTAAERAQAALAAERVKASAVGAALLEGKKPDEALVTGQEAQTAREADFYTWYTIDPDVVYPAALDWLDKNRTALREAVSQSPGDLTEQALRGDALALFVLKARQTVVKVLSVPAEGWKLARQPRSVFDPAITWDGVTRRFAEGEALSKAEEQVLWRGLALNATYAFFTEALHQAHQETVGIGEHILKSEDWKL